MKQTGIFKGRAEVLYNYGRYGWTRGGGKVWHGGLDLVGLDDTTVRMPYYKGKRITGRVVRARIVTDRRDKTWEWGWYVCVQLDAGQTPDTVNFLYFCHCAKLLVSVGQKVSSGDALGIMGNTGNAADGSPIGHLEAAQLDELTTEDLEQLAIDMGLTVQDGAKRADLIAQISTEPVKVPNGRK